MCVRIQRHAPRAITQISCALRINLPRADLERALETLIVILEHQLHTVLVEVRTPMPAPTELVTRRTLSLRLACPDPIALGLIHGWSLA